MDRERFPRVTSIISEVLLPPDYFKNCSTEKGSLVHTTLELYDQNNLDEDCLAYELRTYLNSYKEFKATYEPDILEIEKRFVSDIYGFSGQPDRIIKIADNYFVLDIKTGNHEPWHTVQLAAYWLLAKSLYNPLGIANLYLSDCRPFQFITYSIEEREEARTIFTACLTIKNFRDNKIKRS